MWEGLELSRNSCSGGTQAQQGFTLSRGPGSRGNQAEQGLRLTLPQSLYERHMCGVASTIVCFHQTWPHSAPYSSSKSSRGWLPGFQQAARTFSRGGARSAAPPRCHGVLCGPAPSLELPAPPARLRSRGPEVRGTRSLESQFPPGPRSAGPASGRPFPCAPRAGPGSPAGTWEK